MAMTSAIAESLTAIFSIATRAISKRANSQNKAKNQVQITGNFLHSTSSLPAGLPSLN